MHDGQVGVPVVCAAHRWACLVVQASRGQRPVQSVDDWAVVARMSQRTLRNRCIAAGVRTKPSLDLARMLWAISHAEASLMGTMWDLMCDVGDTDPRTMARLLRQAGLGHRDAVPTVERFLCRQTFVAQGPPLRTLRLALASASHVCELTER